MKKKRENEKSPQFVYYGYIMAAIGNLVNNHIIYNTEIYRVFLYFQMGFFIIFKYLLLFF